MNQVVYISSTQSNQLEVWKIEKNGLLNLKQVIKINGQLQPLCINKKKKILYIGIRPKLYLLSYKINFDGSLNFYKKTKLFSSLNHIYYDKNNKFIFCSSYHYNSLSILKLNKNGIPISKSLLIIPNIMGCHASYMNFINKKLFITALKENKIYVYDMNSNIFSIFKNSITLKTDINSGPRHICFNKNNKYFYNINELNGTVNVWNLKNINNIIKIQNINIFPNNINIQPWASDIHFHPSGKFLYVCERKLNLIILFNIFNNGSHLKINKHFITEIQPRSFDISKNGKFLIIAGEKSNTIACYSINNKTGWIKLISTHCTGKNPLWVLTYKL